MPEHQVSFAAARGLALARAAEAMLRTLGGCEVALRFPVVLSNSGNARLATATSTTEDLLLAPVVARSTRQNMQSSSQMEFIFPAGPVASVLEQRHTDAENLFRSAIGIVYQGRLFRVTDVATDFHAGAAYLYRVSTCE